MNNENLDIVLNSAQTKSALSARVSSLALSSITSQTQGLLLRMFSDPYLLEKEEKANLVVQLRECVAKFPEVSELRVLLGMALCVNLDVHPAIEEHDAVAGGHRPGVAMRDPGEGQRQSQAPDPGEHTLAAAELPLVLRCRHPAGPYA